MDNKVIENTPKINMNSVNVHGIRSYVKRQKMFTWLKRKHADIYFLQETYSTKEVEKQWSQEWKGKVVFSHGTNHSKGVALLIKENFECEINVCKADLNGRFLIVDLNIQGQSMLFINVYAPCSDKPKDQVDFWNKLSSSILEINNWEEKQIICGGDINFLMNIYLDRSGGNPQHDDNVMRSIQNFLEVFDLVDIWRVRNP